MISVCVPTKDAGPAFGLHLRAWRDQQIDEEFELLVADSGSHDETVSTAHSLADRVLTIPPAEFNHGETRNRLAGAAQGDLLVFSVQDAVPTDDSLLRQLCGPLRQDPQLAGVTGKQVPHPDADPVARWEVDSLNRRLDKGLRVKRLESLDDFQRRDFEQRFSLVAFDNVCSAVRRSAWERTPFSRVEFGEDLDWSFRILQGGGHILHNPQAHIRHSHNWTPRRRLRRYFIGSRSSLCILHLPPEHSILRDRDAARGVEEFNAWVQQLIAQQDERSLLLPRILHTLFPERRRKALRATAHLVARHLLRRHVALRLRLGFANLLSQVSQLNGSSTLRSPHVLENLAAILVGGFLGSYYHTCQVENRVTSELDALVRRVGADG